ncbi:MAG TPA: hypothetical protein VJ438_06440 [Candidatus Nanoarchaeia archaeon]|nr:hypothetical protein [Candidatus Nanoarchaeia archaeon]
MKKTRIIFILVILLINMAGLVFAVQGNGSQGNNSGAGVNQISVGNNETDNRNVVTLNKTKIEKENLVFSPWQKRNESECLEGCSCQGAVMSCETETGKIMTIQAGRSGNTIIITVNRIQVETELEVEAENLREEGVQERNRTRLRAILGDGTKKEIKTMPDVASETALQKLNLKNCNLENNCNIQLKEVGSDKSKQIAYEVQAQRHSRILAIFKAKMQVKAQVDAETGELIIVKKPWWAFLATEPKE